MTAGTPTAVLQAPPVPRAARRRRSRRPSFGHTTLVMFPLVVGSVVTLAYTAPDYRMLATPVLAMVNVTAFFFAVLWERDGELPVFEIGSLCMAATLVYSAMPFLGFMVSGLQWDSVGDGRLVAYRFDLNDVAAFAWRYVVYITSFALIYLLVRGRKTASGAPLDPVPQKTITALVMLLLFQYFFQISVYYLYGLSLDVSYNELADLVDRMRSWPYVVQQISFIVIASVLIVKQALILVLVRRWKVLPWRLLLLGWLAFEVGSVILRLGQRGTAIRILLTFVVMFHRFVRPLKAFWLAIGGSLLLVAFLVHGIVRLATPEQLQDLNARAVIARTNEFQALFATAYDLHQRKELHTLPPVPWQVYVSDLYLVIPSQVLPFYKWDPSVWYLEVLGARGQGVGYMFGVMAQAIIGFDWIELVARGALLGVVFALLHRWYVKHAHSLWVTLLYLFIAIWSYYTFRATSFWYMHYVVYQFLPVMVIVELLSMAMKGRGAAAPARSGR